MPSTSPSTAGRSLRTEKTLLHRTNPWVLGKFVRADLTTRSTKSPTNCRGVTMTSNRERLSNRLEGRCNDISSIPDDILVSLIFVRLPARYILDVVRFVCKSWYSLTKSPCFILSHARRARARTNILFDSKMKSTIYQVSLNESSKGTARRRTILDRVTLDLPSKLMAYVSRGLVLSASCDGLLCFNFRRIGYIVCNPVTKDWINVPRRNLGNGGDDFYIIAFYFHSSIGEYRLLGQHFEKGDECIRNIGYEVFTIGGSNRTWRPINASSGIEELLWRSHIFVHESVHFLYYRYQCIVAFDTNTEKFKRISISGVHRQAYFNDNLLNLIEMGGSLGLCQTYSTHQNDIYSIDQMDIWYLKDYTKEEWVKQYTVSLWDIGIFSVCNVLAIWEDEKELLLRSDYRSIVLYSLESKTFTKRVFHKSYPYPRNCVTHIESLVSCNSLSSFLSQQ